MSSHISSPTHTYPHYSPSPSMHQNACMSTHIYTTHPYTPTHSYSPTLSMHQDACMSTHIYTHPLIHTHPHTQSQPHTEHAPGHELPFSRYGCQELHVLLTVQSFVLQSVYYMMCYIISCTAHRAELCSAVRVIHTVAVSLIQIVHAGCHMRVIGARC